MRELIEYIARSLVDDPTQVQVWERKRGDNVELSLKVSKSDMGRVIGRNGRVANAMRKLLNVAAAGAGQHAFLRITDPE
jgi:hypothetical protein